VPAQGWRDGDSIVPAGPRGGGYESYRGSAMLGAKVTGKS